MKKVIYSTVMLLGLAFGVQAQDISKNALGLRLGSNNGIGGEVSYQRGLGSNNRLEVGFGWRDNENYDAYQLTGLYQWVWNIDGGFNWYAGVGGGFASFSSKNHDESALFVAGDIGVEYNFDIPLQLSLDFRPEIYFNDGIDDDFGPNIGLGIRYRF